MTSHDEGYNEVIAPGAFASQVGKRVPLTLGPGGPVIGTAEVTAEGEIVATIDNPQEDQP
jgi:hypothetical protein